MPCFRRFLQEKLWQRAVPVLCPEPGCAEAVTQADCKAVLPTSDFDRWLQVGGLTAGRNGTIEC